MTKLSEIAVPQTYDHPLSDPDFAQEHEDSRAHILKWWDIVTEVDDAPRMKRGETIARVAFVNGLPERTVKNIHSAWRTGNAHRTRYPSRDWRALANRSKWPDPKEANLPAAFVSWVKDVAEQHQRDTSFAQAYRSVMAALALWERDPFNPDAKIPGYSTPPVRNAFTGHPEGWSQTNLQRRCKSTAYEKAVRRQGPKAASKFLPSVRTTRGPDADGRCLEFGEIIYFDDQWHDTYINLTGVNSRAMRPQSFNALEALSGSCFEVGLKPQIWDEELGKRRELDQLVFCWFVMLVLTKHGYNPDAGTTLIWEHGTSTVDKRDPRTTPDHFNNLIHRITNGKVLVDVSGKFGAPAFKSMLFGGQPSGNFRFKAPIESFFNLVRNYHAALPGPTGLNPERAPEESYGLLAANDRMLKLIDEIPTETFLRLKREVLEWEDYKRFHVLAMNAIDCRRQHNLEGWHKLGFTGARYRLGLDKPWIDELDYQAIPAEERALYRSIVSQPGNNETFNLSPREVFMMRRRQLTRMPMRMIPMLAPARAWTPVTVTQSLEMVITDKWLDSEPLYFIGKVVTQKGLEVHLKRGETYKRLLNIFDPSRMWIADRNGAYIGLASRVQTGCKLNHDAILRQLGEINHVKAAENVEIHARMQSEAATRVAARKFNRDLIERGATTPEEKVALRKQDRTQQSAARFGEILRNISDKNSTPNAFGDATDAQLSTLNPQPSTDQEIEKW